MPKATLMQHQIEGVKFLESADGIGALLWSPGVGKTGAVLSWVDLQARKHGEFRVLVVAPLTAADTWILQPPMFMDSVVKARMWMSPKFSTLDIFNNIAKSRDWANMPDAPIQVNHKGTRKAQVSGNRVTVVSISAGAVSSYCDERTKTIRMLRAIRKYQPHLIVLDESHIAKAPTSNISKAMYQMGQLVPHRIILTGTVNPHSILDCYGQWRFFAPWTFSDQANESFVANPLTMTRAEQASIRPWSWGRFKNNYAEAGGYKGKGISRFINEDDLRDRVAERSMVVEKKDALDLPPTNDVDIHVTLTPREMRAYREMAEDLAAELDDGSMLEVVNALAKLMKLRQIAAGFVKDTETGEVHIIGDSLRKAMIEVATTQLAGEDRLVMFSYFKPECALLTEALRKKEPGTTVETITGFTKASERLAIRKRFGDVSRNPERTILVAQSRTMSLSVNELITAQHAIYGSYSERRDDWQQSRDRLDRKGQTAPVTFWNCFTPGLIGEIMRDNHRDRGVLEKVLLDHVRQVAANR